MDWTDRWIPTNASPIDVAELIKINVNSVD